MPYIDRYLRIKYDESIRKIVRELADSEKSGEITYVLFSVLSELCKLRGKELNYEYLNSLLGSIECAKSEYVKRILEPYEDQKLIGSW